MNAQQRLDAFLGNRSQQELKILILVAEHNLLVKDVEFERLEDSHHNSLNEAMEA